MQYEVQPVDGEGSVTTTEGASLTAITDRVNNRDAVRMPSEMVKVMSTLPFAFGTGVTVPVQLGQVPLQLTAPVDATMDGRLDV